MRRIVAIALASFFACGTSGRARTIVSNQQGVEVIVSQPDDLTHRQTAAPARTPVAATRPVRSMPVRAAGTVAGRLTDIALGFLGARYVWGGASPSGFDCSGYTWYAFSRMGIAIPRTADSQFEAGRPVNGQPAPGDLVFFQTYDYGASHVGIYLGNGRFVSSIGTDVHVATFATPYFRSRYLGARRFLPG